MRGMIDLRTEGLNRTIAWLGELPHEMARARVSAMKSTGWMIRGEIRAAYERQGRGSHKLSRQFRETKGGRWTKTAKGQGLAWFGRFTRYAVADDGSSAVIALGRTAKKVNAFGSLDRDLTEKARKHEYGKSFPVSDKMRRKFAATKRAAGWKPLPGGRRRKPGKGLDYEGRFVTLRKGTRSIHVPARPVWVPTKDRIRERAVRWYEERFVKAMNRYAGRGGRK